MTTEPIPDSEQQAETPAPSLEPYKAAGGWLYRSQDLIGFIRGGDEKALAVAHMLNNHASLVTAVSVAADSLARLEEFDALKIHVQNALAQCRLALSEVRKP